MLSRCGSRPHQVRTALQPRRPVQWRFPGALFSNFATELIMRVRRWLTLEAVKRNQAGLVDEIKQEASGVIPEAAAGARGAVEADVRRADPI